MNENERPISPSISGGCASVIEETTCDEPSDEAAQRFECCSIATHHSGCLDRSEIERHEHKGLKLGCVSGLSEQRRAAGNGGGLTSTYLRT